MWMRRTRWAALGALAVGSLLALGSCGTSGSSGTNLTPDQTPGSQPLIGVMQSGDGTYYGADGSGNCSYDASPGDLMVAAMNDPQWNNSSVCGECLDVTGPLGKVTVRIVDRCPECKSGDLDLSQQAFVKIADQSAGRVKISWVPVACAVSGPLSYRFKEGSSQYWMAVQVRNSRLPVNKIELQQGSGWLTLDQQSYNYYIAANNPGPGPYTFRVTAIDGQQITESGVALMPASVVAGSQQFK
jgi:expansin (peptidoglycan-binding protein)